jgi:hypothetical protein
MIIKSTGTVGIDGALRLHKRKEFDNLLKDFKGSDVLITVSKKFKRRSVNQNSYYWGVVVTEIRDRLNELGHNVTLDLTHEMLKARFNVQESVNESTGEVFSFPKSTTEMNTEAFCEYIDKIIIFAKQSLDIDILYPNEQGELFP